MSIIQGTAKGGSASFYDFPIEQSLRFDGSSYLSRTPSTAGNRKTWTWSSWVKRSKTLVNNGIFSAGTSFGSNNDNLGTISFSYSSGQNGDNLEIASENNGATSYRLITTQLFRDTSAWYHIIVAVDTTQLTSTNQIKLYINGFQVTGLETSTYPSQNYDSWINSTNSHRIGVRSLTDFNGYLANIQFIDGQALDPYFFGEFKDNIWVPYNAFSTAGSGTATASDGDTATDSYGTNGFHLTFEDGIELLPVSGYTDNQNAFRDKSHNTNHWKTN